MRILFFSSLYPPNTRGGGEISTHMTARGLLELGHDVQVICWGERRDEGVLDGVSILRLPIPVLQKPIFERPVSRLVARALRKEIRRFEQEGTRFDVLHAHDFRMGLALGELQDSRSVATLRDYAAVCGSPHNMMASGVMCDDCSLLTNILKLDHVQEASSVRRLFRIWQYWWNTPYRRKIFRAYSRLIFISEAQREIITPHLQNDSRRDTVIFNPIADEWFDRPTVPGEARKFFKGSMRENKRQSRFDLLYVGSLEPHKGVGLLLGAFEGLANQFPDVNLRLIGEGSHRKTYEKWVELKGLQYRITFSGRVSYQRLQDQFDEARIIVAPHLWVEPFGRTVVEGMARGKVVVAANSGGPSEVITSGENGILFEPRSEDALRRAMIEALDLPDARREVVTRSAQSFVRDTLTTKIIAKQYEDFYF